MEATRAVIALVCGIVAIFFVPTLVWSTVVAGLYQIVWDKTREILRAFARKSAVSNKQLESRR